VDMYRILVIHALACAMWITLSLTHTSTHHGLFQLSRDVLSPNVANRAAIARASMRTLPMLSPAEVLGTGVAWICTVLYLHTHRHA
jgi:hypothetical protein